MIVNKDHITRWLELNSQPRGGQSGSVFSSDRDRVRFQLTKVTRTCPYTNIIGDAKLKTVTVTVKGSDSYIIVNSPTHTI